MKSLIRYLFGFIVICLLVNWGAKLLAEVWHVLFILAVIYFVGLVAYKVIKIKQDWR